MTKNQPVIYCDFCEKSQHEIADLVQGPKDIAICNECVDLCVKVIAEKRPKESA